MNKNTILHLIRHGDVHNPDAVYYGRLPRFGLSVLGRQQAENAGIFLTTHNTPIAAIYNSPMLRAKQTAGILHQHFAVPRHTSSLINEVHSPYDGRSLEWLKARQFNLFIGAPPEFEQAPDIVARVTRFCKRVKRKYAGKEIIAVAHGDVVAYSFLWANGVALTHDNRQQLGKWGMTDFYPANACILSLTLAPNQTKPIAVRYINPHPDDK